MSNTTNFVLRSTTCLVLLTSCLPYPIMVIQSYILDEEEFCDQKAQKKLNTCFESKC